jgi:hypothetical protein
MVRTLVGIGKNVVLRVGQDNLSLVAAGVEHRERDGRKAQVVQHLVALALTVGASILAIVALAAVALIPAFCL